MNELFVQKRRFFHHHAYRVKSLGAVHCLTRQAMP
jgi:hypothetical protein